MLGADVGKERQEVWKETLVASIRASSIASLPFAIKMVVSLRNSLLGLTSEMALTTATILVSLQWRISCFSADPHGKTWHRHRFICWVGCMLVRGLSSGRWRTILLRKRVLWRETRRSICGFLRSLLERTGEFLSPLLSRIRERS